MKGFISRLFGINNYARYQFMYLNRPPLVHLPPSESTLYDGLVNFALCICNQNRSKSRDQNETGGSVVYVVGCHGAGHSNRPSDVAWDLSYLRRAP